MTYRFKHEGFEVGDRIRAYDFEPRPEIGDRYVEGMVMSVHRDGSSEFPFAHYYIAVEVDTVFTENPREFVAVPMETSMLDWDGRVRAAA